MKKTYCFANLFWLALAAFAAVGSWRLEVGTLHNPGAGFLPFYAAILFGILALVSLLQDLKAMSGSASELWDGVRWVKWITMVTSLFIYVAILDWVGFMLATFLLMLVLFRLLEPYRWPKVVLFSLLTMGSAYLFFVALLDSRLPRGSLWGF
ncbi:MAG: tripartite tricarboxylate transporter TctB family protein [Desulfobacterales bacterium]|nr:tripartite tricarboxylate transporter TctB family protein [Desulfobacterales bacterium]